MSTERFIARWRRGDGHQQVNAFTTRGFFDTRKEAEEWVRDNETWKEWDILAVTDVHATSEPVRTITLQAALDDALHFSMGWIDGTDPSDPEVSFSLTCGAGLGGSHLTLTVHVGDKRICEKVNMLEAIEPWVRRLVEELRAS